MRLMHLLTFGVFSLTVIFSLYIAIPTKIGASVLYDKSDIQVRLTQTDIKPSELPLRITIPNADVNLNVSVGQIEGNTWSVSDEEAFFAEGSSLLDSKKGNTIIYAHARDGLFGGLGKIKKGDIISVIGESNIYDYEMVKVELVSPDEIDKIKSTGEYNLTLFTCEGYKDEYRLVVKAKRINDIVINREVI